MIRVLTYGDARRVRLGACLARPRSSSRSFAARATPSASSSPSPIETAGSSRRSTQDDFEIRDEGKPQPITLFDNTPQPIRLIVMLDVSGSMEGNLPLLRAGAGAAVRAAAPGRSSRASARSGTRSTISPSFTRDPRELRAALPRAIAPDAPTPLWRAIDEALDAFGDEDARRAA